jgi:hypothetical protein
MGPKSQFSLDLHVLGAPLTFALSQDQTLQLNLLSSRERPCGPLGALSIVCTTCGFVGTHPYFLSESTVQFSKNGRGRCPANIGYKKGSLSTSPSQQRQVTSSEILENIPVSAACAAVCSDRTGGAIYGGAPRSSTLFCRACRFVNTDGISGAYGRPTGGMVPGGTERG